MKNLLICSTFFLALISAPAFSSGDTSGQTAAGEVKQLVTEFNQAYERNDLDRYFSFYLAGATLWTNEEYSTVETYQASWTEFIDAGGAVQKNVLSELNVRISPAGDSAVASYRLDIETMQPDGSASTDRAQETDVWFRVDGTWKIAHLHYTFQPVD